jgi:hypothetical protein
LTLLGCEALAKSQNGAEVSPIFPFVHEKGEKN